MTYVPLALGEYTFNKNPWQRCENNTKCSFNQVIEVHKTKTFIYAIFLNRVEKHFLLNLLLPINVAAIIWTLSYTKTVWLWSFHTI